MQAKSLYSFRTKRLLFYPTAALIHTVLPCQPIFDFRFSRKPHPQGDKAQKLWILDLFRPTFGWGLHPKSQIPNLKSKILNGQEYIYSHNDRSDSLFKR